MQYCYLQQIQLKLQLEKISTVATRQLSTRQQLLLLPDSWGPDSSQPRIAICNNSPDVALFHLNRVIRIYPSWKGRLKIFAFFRAQSEKHQHSLFWLKRVLFIVNLSVERAVADIVDEKATMEEQDGCVVNHFSWSCFFHQRQCTARVIWYPYCVLFSQNRPTQLCTKRIFREGSFWVASVSSLRTQYLVRQRRKMQLICKRTVEQNPPWAGQQNNPHFIVGLFSLQIGTGTIPFIGRFVNYGLNLWGSIYTPQHNNFGFVQCSIFPIFYTQA